MHLTPEQVATAIGIPTHEWIGNCHTITTAMIHHKLVRGEICYGHYFGAIHPDSVFGNRQFTHHSWIERKSTIVDPTRWVFECVSPYIYVGPKDDKNYDFGGNNLRKMMMKPPPAFDINKKSWKIRKGLRNFINAILECGNSRITIEQLLWVANCPLDILGIAAKPVYEWIRDDIKMPGFIPLDNRMRILGDIN